MIATIYESQYPLEQDAPLGWWGNPIEGWGTSFKRIVARDFQVVGYMNGQLWLRSKTGDSSDSIQINMPLISNRVYEDFYEGMTCTFNGELKYDFTANRWYIQWSCVDRYRTN